MVVVVGLDTLLVSTVGGGGGDGDGLDTLLVSTVGGEYSWSW